LHKTLQAVHLMVSSKKGISAHQLHRILDVQYRTAWFLAHRIREAMRSGVLAPMAARESLSRSMKPTSAARGMRKSRGPSRKMKALSLVERDGNVRPIRVESVSRPTVEKIVRENVDRESWLMTDEARWQGAHV
jgi:hypothetical protein